MKNYEYLKSLQVTFLISVLVHIGLFISLRRSPSELKNNESQPTFVDFINRSDTAEKAAQLRPSQKKDDSESASPRGNSVKVPPPPQPAEKTIQTPPNLAKALELPVPNPQEFSKAAEAPTPGTLESAKAKSDITTLPGMKELIPSPFELAKKETSQSGPLTDNKVMDEETISLEEPELRYESYVRGVGMKIEAVWRYPEAAKISSLEGNGLISITINRSGDLIDVELLTSSGHSILDEAIVEAIRKASPFNPFQENMPLKRLNIVATFQYHLISPGYIWVR